MYQSILERMAFGFGQGIFVHGQFDIYEPALLSINGLNILPVGPLCKHEILVLNQCQPSVHIRWIFVDLT